MLLPSSFFFDRDVIAVGRFTFADTEREVEDDVSLQVGGEYELNYISSNIKTRDQPKLSLFHGTSVVEQGTSDNTPANLMFKFEPSSWHYGWRSSKHTKNLTHAFWVYIFCPVPGSPTKVRCVLRCCTRSFTLASSKRAKLQPDASTAQAAHRSNATAELAFSKGTEIPGLILVQPQDSIDIGWSQTICGISYSTTHRRRSGPQAPQKKKSSTKKSKTQKRKATTNAGGTEKGQFPSMLLSSSST